MQYHKYPISLWHRLKAGGKAFLTDPHVSESLAKISSDFVALKSNLNTRRAYKNDLHQFLHFLGADGKTLGELVSRTKSQLQSEIHDFLSAQVKRDILGEYVVNGWTVNRKLYTIAGFFRYLRNTYDFPFDPVVNLPPYPVPNQSNAPALTKDEI